MGEFITVKKIEIPHTFTEADVADLNPNMVFEWPEGVVGVTTYDPSTNKTFIVLLNLHNEFEKARGFLARFSETKYLGTIDHIKLTVKE